MTHMELFPSGMILPDDIAGHLYSLQRPETFLQGRLGHETNEDGFFISFMSEGCSATVVDGVTPTTNWRDMRDRSSGKLAADGLIDLVFKMRGLSFDRDMFMDEAHKLFQSIRRQTQDPDTVAGAVMAHLHAHDRTIYVFGDCKAGLTVDTPDGLMWQNLTGELEKGGNTDAQRRIACLQQLLTRPEYTNWQENSQARRQLARESWQALQDGRRVRVKDNPLYKRNRYPDWWQAFQLPDGTRTVHLFSDGFLQAWPTLGAGRACIAYLKEQDPWMMGAGIPDLITPKCFVDDRTGAYVDQLDDMVGVIVPVNL